MEVEVQERIEIVETKFSAGEVYTHEHQAYPEILPWKYSMGWWSSKYLNGVPVRLFRQEREQA